MKAEYLMNIYFRFFFVSMDHLILSQSLVEYFSPEYYNEINKYILTEHL